MLYSKIVIGTAHGRIITENVKEGGVLFKKILPNLVYMYIAVELHKEKAVWDAVIFDIPDGFKPGGEINFSLRCYNETVAIARINHDHGYYLRAVGVDVNNLASCKLTGPVVYYIE